MKRISEIKAGETLNNDQLMEIFKCSPQGGMRKSNKTNSLVIVSNHVNSIYDDRWEDDILYYTGMGTEGNQSFDFMQNKTLYESNTNNITVYLFEVYIQKQYTFTGKVALAKSPFIEKQLDAYNKERDVCIFPLKVIDGKIPPIDIEILEKNKEAKKNKIKKLDDNALLKLAQKGSQKPRKRNTSVNQYERNEAVAEYAKRLAKGVCLLCGKKAPFYYKDGQPYLEIHHLIWLSKGGSDTIDNTVALCPNCHRKMHIINDKKDTECIKEAMRKIMMNI